MRISDRQSHPASAGYPSRPAVAKHANHRQNRATPIGVEAAAMAAKTVRSMRGRPPAVSVRDGRSVLVDAMDPKIAD